LARCTFVPQSGTKDLALSGNKILQSRIFVVQKKDKTIAKKFSPTICCLEKETTRENKADICFFSVEFGILGLLCRGE